MWSSNRSLNWLKNVHDLTLGAHPSETQYFIYSGFSTLNFSLNTFNIKDATVLTYSNLSDYKSKKLHGYQYTELSFHHSKINGLRSSELHWINLHTLFNSSPLTQSLLSEHTHLSISGLKKQNKEIENTSNIQIVDIFESLKGVYDER